MHLGSISVGSRCVIGFCQLLYPFAALVNWSPTSEIPFLFWSIPFYDGLLFEWLLKLLSFMRVLRSILGLLYLHP